MRVGGESSGDASAHCPSWSTRHGQAAVGMRRGWLRQVADATQPTTGAVLDVDSGARTCPPVRPAVTDRVREISIWRGTP
jgi:hypothetical protein